MRVSRARRFPLGAGLGPADLDRDAHTVLARLRETEPVSWVESLGCWLVSDHALAVTVMRSDKSFTVDDPRFSTARVVGRSMLSVDGAEHVHHRSPFVSPFRPAHAQERFGADVQALAADLVERIAPTGSADLRRSLAGPMSVAVVTAVLGLREVDTDTVLEWYAAIVEAVSTMTVDGYVAPAASRAVGELADSVHASVSAHASVTGHRQRSLLVDAAPSLTQAELVANAAVMMFGGIETTEGMILNFTLHLLQHPAELDRVSTEPALLAPALEESLRLEPAAAVVDRYATEDVELAGAQIERGELVRVSLTGANRDPKVFGEPDAFDPTRPNLRTQLAFARGPHVCIAMDLARLEARAAVRALTSRLPDLRQAGTSAPRGLIFRKPPALPVRWSTGAPTAPRVWGPPAR